jgi:hypothetical protein
MVASGADSGGYFIEGRMDRSRRRKKNKGIIINKLIFFARNQQINLVLRWS